MTAGTLVATVRTSPSMLDLALSFLRTVPTASRESFAVLWAHFALETGRGRSCFNFNIGNVKHVSGDGYDFIGLRGVWEGVSLGVYEQMKRGPWGHLVRLDEDEAHKRAVYPNVAVILEPPHPGSLFRAYPSLDVALDEHVSFLTKRYPEAWGSLLDGDASSFARHLKKRGYFTASEEAYTRGLEAGCREALSASTFEKAIALYKDEIAGAETEPGIAGGVIYAKPDPIKPEIDLDDDGRPKE